MALELVKNYNQENNYCSKIIESSIVEKINTGDNQPILHSEFSSIELILKNYDKLYNHIPENEKEFHLKQVILDFISAMDSEYFESKKINKKIYKEKVLNTKLHSKSNNLSILYLLNEYYQKHFIFVIEKKFYTTSIKNYEKVFIQYDKNKYSFLEIDNESDYKEGNFDDLVKITTLMNDINKYPFEIFIVPKLDSFQKSKINDLKDLSIKNNLPIVNIITGKNKVKKDLYRELMIHFINFN